MELGDSGVEGDGWFQRGDDPLGTGILEGVVEPLKVGLRAIDFECRVGEMREIGLREEGREGGGREEGRGEGGRRV